MILHFPADQTKEFEFLFGRNLYFLHLYCNANLKHIYIFFLMHGYVSATTLNFMIFCESCTANFMLTFIKSSFASVVVSNFLFYLCLLHGECNMYFFLGGWVTSVIVS